MKNKGWFIIGAIIISLIVIIIIINIKQARKENRVNHFDFPNTMIVNNHTDYRRADTLAMIVLNKIYVYDIMTVNIYYMNSDMGNDKFDVAGFIQKNPYKQHDYNIFIKKKTLPVSIKKFLSHELIHLNQMESGDLIQLQDNTKIIYKGDTISFFDVPYDKRPYEIEALTKEDKILKKINKLLYIK